MEFFPLLEKLADLMSTMEGFDIPAINDTLAQLCKTLHISKGVTNFYHDTECEKTEKGETFVCYDSGEDHVLISKLRTVTPTGTVVTCSTYQPKGAAPLSEEEQRRAAIVQKMVLTLFNRSRLEESLHRMMYYDDDGYNNIRYFYAQIVRIRDTGRLAGKSAARINIKHFSTVNEQFGKETGDVVLRKYCQALKEAMGEDGILCRLGGDNFVLLFDSKNLPRVLSRFAGTLIVPGQDMERKVELAAYAGVCSFDENDVIHNPGEVMERIITPYLITKRDNTADVILFNQELANAKVKAAKIQRKFNKALQKEEFVVYYQPKVDIHSREIAGAEALCRWIRKGKIIPPMDFIPVLERGYDICRLDFYMLDHVCRDIRRWIDEGKSVKRISVNLSRRHMTDPELFTHIVEIIDRNNVPHSLIEIELTETTTDVEFRDLKRVVTELQEAGIATSVDDFGVGYSSLNLIKQIPWDVLKLDKSILPAHGDDMERGTHMFAHVIAMAHEMGLVCVAEGVETEEQLNLMRNYGCRLAQGYLFDRPMAAEEFEKRMNRQERGAEKYNV